ncbi:uncharacterized protein LOC124500555 isoform X1 [Dermatophagoides farinae]|uniref:uncharacterized protein LOC124500555 isoform X1 n=1 Tax=Dermatophagoides farinae TaxID=6954 RepID=UPI003F5E72B6
MIMLTEVANITTNKTIESSSTSSSTINKMESATIMNQSSSSSTINNNSTSSPLTSAAAAVNATGSLMNDTSSLSSSSMLSNLVPGSGRFSNGSNMMKSNLMMMSGVGGHHHHQQQHTNNQTGVDSFDYNSSILFDQLSTTSKNLFGQPQLQQQQQQQQQFGHNSNQSTFNMVGNYFQQQPTNHLYMQQQQQQQQVMNKIVQQHPQRTPIGSPSSNGSKIRKTSTSVTSTATTTSSSTPSQNVNKSPSKTMPNQSPIIGVGSGVGSKNVWKSNGNQSTMTNGLFHTNQSISWLQSTPKDSDHILQQMFTDLQQQQQQQQRFNTAVGGKFTGLMANGHNDHIIVDTNNFGLSTTSTSSSSSPATMRDIYNSFVDTNNSNDTIISSVGGNNSNYQSTITTPNSTASSSWTGSGQHWSDQQSHSNTINIQMNRPSSTTNHNQQESNGLFNVWNVGNTAVVDSINEHLNTILGHQSINNNNNNNHHHVHHTPNDSSIIWSSDQWLRQKNNNVDNLMMPILSSTSSLYGSISNNSNSSISSNNNINKDSIFRSQQQSKLLLDFYHDNLEYFMKEDLHVTKTMLDFYMENFSLRSTNISTPTTSQQSNPLSSSLEMEQIILNRLLSRKSDTNPASGDSMDSDWDEFANVYYDLQENERRLQYLDKVLIQSKLEEMKKLYTLWFMSAMQLSSNNSMNSINIESDSGTTKTVGSSTTTSSSSSLEQNNNNNQSIQNYQQCMANVQDKLKQLQMDLKMLQQDSGLKQFQITVLRLLKYYRKLFNMIPKEILLNLSIINQLQHNNNNNIDDDSKILKNAKNSSINDQSSDDDDDDNNDGNNSDEAFSDVDQESESSRSIDCISSSNTTTTTTIADQRKLQHSYRQFLKRVRCLSANQQHLLYSNDMELKKNNRKNRKTSSASLMAINKNNNSSNSMMNGCKTTIGGGGGVSGNDDDVAATITPNKNKNKSKSYPQIVRLRMEQSLYFPYYYPMSADSLNIHGPITVVYNRPPKTGQRMIIGHLTHNWNLIETIEQETHRSGTTGTLVLEPKFSVSISDSMGNNNLIISQDSQATVPTSMLKLINRLRTLFPNVPINQLVEIIRQAKYILVKRYKIQYGFSGFKMGQLVKFISDLIVEMGVQSATPSQSIDTMCLNSNNPLSVAKIVNGSTVTTTTTTTIASKGGISWSKIAAQNSSSSSIPSTPTVKDFGCASSLTSSTSTATTNTMTGTSGILISSATTPIGMISPIMMMSKPTPSSTPLSSTSSSSLISTTSLTGNNNNNNSFGLNNQFQSLSVNSNHMNMMNTSFTSSSLSSLMADNNNSNNNNNNGSSGNHHNCALCHKTMMAPTINNNSVTSLATKLGGGGFRYMPHCKHLFHKECFESIQSTTTAAAAANSSILNNNTNNSNINISNNNINVNCPLCEKLFVLRKDEFPSLN